MPLAHLQVLFRRFAYVTAWIAMGIGAGEKWVAGESAVLYIVVK